MLEIRFHGRGGQGTVIASKVLAAAFFKEGHYVQAFPAFGVERRGAPVAAFARIDESPIRLRCEVYQPDHLIVLEPTLTETLDITAGLKTGGSIVLNSHRRPGATALYGGYRLGVVDANAIALRYGLGTRSAPIVNTAILGAFARLTGLVGLDAVVEAIVEYVPVKQESNERAARDAYDETITMEPQSEVATSPRRIREANE